LLAFLVRLAQKWSHNFDTQKVTSVIGVDAIGNVHQQALFGAGLAVAL
jgi:hypothetical protein